LPILSLSVAGGIDIHAIYVIRIMDIPPENVVVTLDSTLNRRKNAARATNTPAKRPSFDHWIRSVKYKHGVLIGPKA